METAVARRIGSFWQPWVAALRGLPDNPLPEYLRRLERRRSLGAHRGSRFTNPALFIVGAIVLAGLVPSVGALAGLPTWLSSLGVPLLLGYVVLLPVARGALGLLARPAGAARANDGALQLDELLASTPLTDTEVVVGVLRHLWPRLALACALLAMLVCVQQLAQTAQQQGVYRTLRYPRPLQTTTQQTVLDLLQTTPSPWRLGLGLAELASGGTDPALRFSIGLPLTYCGMLLSGLLAALGWTALLIACGRGLSTTLFVPAATVGGLLTQAVLFYGLSQEWQSQRLAGAYGGAADLDWLLSSAALTLVALALSLQLLAVSSLWRVLVATGLPLLGAAGVPWVLATLVYNTPVGAMAELHQALASGLSGMQLVLSTAALANPLAAPLPLYGGITPGGLFTPPLWHWLSWPVLLGCQLLLTVALLGQARLAVALQRGAVLE